MQSRRASPLSPISVVPTAYVDGSFFLSMVLRRTGAQDTRSVFDRYDRVLSGDLIVTEALSVARREGADVDVVPRALGLLDLIHPSRSLMPEIRHTLEQAYLRGADLWHVACALFVAIDLPEGIAFLSRDRSQQRVAHELGFETP